MSVIHNNDYWNHREFCLSFCSNCSYLLCVGCNKNCKVHRAINQFKKEIMCPFNSVNQDS